MGPLDPTVREWLSFWARVPWLSVMQPFCRQAWGVGRWVMGCNAASSGTLPESLAGRKAGKGWDDRADRDAPDIPDTPASLAPPAFPAQRGTPDIPGTPVLPVPEVLPAPPEAQDILALPAQWVPVEPWDRKGRFLPATAPAGAWAAARPRCARPPACAPDFPGKVFLL